MCLHAAPKKKPDDQTECRIPIDAVSAPRPPPPPPPPRCALTRGARQLKCIVKSETLPLTIKIDVRARPARPPRPAPRAPPRPAALINL